MLPKPGCVSTRAMPSKSASSTRLETDRDRGSSSRIMARFSARPTMPRVRLPRTPARCRVLQDRAQAQRHSRGRRDPGLSCGEDGDVAWLRRTSRFSLSTRSLGSGLLHGSSRAQSQWVSRRTPKPVPPLGWYGFALLMKAVPAMSRWAQGVSPTKRSRNLRGGDHAGVASRRNCGRWRPRCRPSCRTRARRGGARYVRRWPRRRRSAPRIRDRHRCPSGRPRAAPSATTHAPVSVARSTMHRGSKCLRAYANASASTTRPSASVLSTSMVVPSYARMMSLGR